ncbi:hypothetical protein [Amycolatopsis tolypomycina]|uniref:hypothetical protein n=1 Tax=Amycolatopsis tolypomycina TaxID=208445 RepID=UPI001FC93E66|nr:hypothetical protein [Amycolatopsis tolypomycina]
MENTSAASDLPFMPEKPSCAYAVALSQPRCDISRPWNASSADTCDEPPVKPPSNGMIEKLSGVNPIALAWSSSCVPNQPVPAAVPGMVTDTNRPGLFACNVFAAPSSLAIAAVFSYSGSSRSKSIALSEYWVMTCWYAAATVPQVCPSLVPP